MTKQRKIIFLIAGALTAAGLVMGSIGWFLSIVQEAPSDRKQLVKAYPISINSLQVDMEQTDVQIQAVSGDNITVTYYDNTQQRYTFTEDNGVLKIVCRENKKWYEYLKIHWFEEPEDLCIIGIPQAYTGSVKIKTMTGDMELSGLTLKNNVSLDGMMGDVSLEETKIEGSLYTNITTGELALFHITVSGDCGLYTTTGEIEVEGLNVNGMLNMGATTGDIDMEDVRARSYSGKLTTGNVFFEGFTPEEQAFFETTTGNILGTIKDDQTLYQVYGQTEMGDMKLPSSVPNGPKHLQVKTTTGDIEISFFNKE